MAELFMECEEEELEPWQRRIPEVVDDDDDDDDEPIFVGEITSSKASANSRQNSAPQRLPVDNGTPNRSTASYNTGPGPTFKAANQHYTAPASAPSVMAVSAIYQPVSRSAGASATSQPAQRPSPAPSSAQPVCRGIPAPIVPQVAVRPLSPASQPVTRSLLIPVTTQPLDRTIPIVTQHVSRTVTAVTAQPIIINNQGYIMSSPQISGSSTLMLGIKASSGGTQYPSGTSIAVLPGVSPQVGRPVQQITQVHQVTPVRTVSNFSHRPQVQVSSTIQSSILSLAHVQSSSQPSSAKLQPVQMTTTKLQPIQLASAPLHSSPVICAQQQSVPVVSPQLQPAPQGTNRTGNSTNPAAKRSSASDGNGNVPKKAKLDAGTPPSASGNVKNGAPFLKACPKCNIHFNLPEPLRNHMRYCCYEMMNVYFPMTSKQETPATPVKSADAEKGKLIMLVNEFYYGKHEGDFGLGQQEQKTNTTFKCCSCLKILKNNIRFMNHMKHHLELEKQSNESWENHTTCQHCYRQYSTPFQLQCHIESAHSPYESTTNCKICELAFESEQVLLQHMKDNHKPGEMPYVCQVCNYRSSFFSEVENHFRSVHENTKYLLCPFCLKVIRSGTPYMQHYMRHQKKGIHRCTKCRLQFLTCKEKMDHKTQHHRTFRKPRSLEGLPPGTKVVTIRASLASGGSPASPNSSSKSIISIIPNSPNAKQSHKSQSSQARSRSSSQNKKQERLNNSKLSGRCTLALRNLRNHLGVQKCVECYTEIKDFPSHYPTFVNCHMCTYRTSCTKAFANHMMRFHTASSRDRLQKRTRPPGSLRGLTLVCLNCDFLTDSSGADSMSKHLTDRQNHTCQVIVEQETAEICTGERIKTEPRDSHAVQEREDSEGSKCTDELNKSPTSPTHVERNERVDPPDPGEAKEVAAGGKVVSESSDRGAALKGERDCSLPHRGSDVKTEPSASDPAQDTPGPQYQTSQDIFKEEPGAKAPPSPSASEEEEKPDSGGSVPFEQFFRKVDEPQSVSSDVSEQGSSHLEALTPSEVLEHEATEILQKGGVAPAAARTPPASDHAEDSGDTSGADQPQDG
nr:PREDICTED: zinc finger protein 280D isoform X1 [Lepisosteus oculatus]XP_015198800.1 PREDICTED: zinc finger protein 280D isoform X1 [Lepisosteus oculatus]XP_015198801.1 PREDICTED: zinc finger protein 280D isoform X1 [Lepisosteus oculatus]XP_015198802.1 PREDICTED: zinc finger protein 280D isoform X1 [Lepisosteus oculatus]